MNRGLGVNRIGGRCEQGHEQGMGIGVCGVCGQEVGVGPGLDGLAWGGLQV